MEQGAKSEQVEDIQKIYSQAVAAHESGEVAEAIELYGKVLAQFPDADVVLYNQGLALFDSERYDEAVAVFSRAAELRRDDADTWYNLGLALKKEQRHSEATDAYKQALALQPDDPDILFNLANCCRESGDREEAAVYYTRLLELEPDNVSALNNFAYLCHLHHDNAQAEQLYLRLLALQPEHPGTRHMLAALTGKFTGTPENAYVRDLFDQYSDSFEQSLIGKLEYRVPELLFDLIRRTQAAQEKNSEQPEQPYEQPYVHCLDLGCGTGLAGKLFSPYCQQLSGVDLSGKMLVRAAEKGIYDRIVADDVVHFLCEDEEQYDLLVAADLFTYLADLEPLLLAAFQRAAPGGLFVFSTEHGEKNQWQVRQTGRFAHQSKYVVEVAQGCGWQLVTSEEADLRREEDAWIRGDLFVLTKKSIKEARGMLSDCEYRDSSEYRDRTERKPQ
ncbi:putative methyltransferase, contains TPR repeat [Candidatus Electrothrix marina]|uniref:Putative methyltransferase, contains TPR repeat n=1 Tax=Candidatus Electrothrix marina TaxID=1859130 RepID=A0A444JDC0_9BACT|nr:putative methyltransferase, contains TPR repeat [Candidatus Electrothrix marina]